MHAKLLQYRLWLPGCGARIALVCGRQELLYACSVSSLPPTTRRKVDFQMATHAMDACILSTYTLCTRVYQEFERQAKLKEEQRKAQVQASIIQRMQSGGSHMSVEDRLRRIGSNVISRRSSGLNISVRVAKRAKDQKRDEITVADLERG